MPGRTEKDLVPWCGAAMRVRSRIGWVVVRTEICLNFDYPTRHDAAGNAMDKQLSEKPWRNLLRRIFKEAARQQLARKCRLLAAYL